MIKKQCSKCKKEKDVNDFYVRPGGKIQSYCRDCKRLYDRNYHNNRTVEAKKIKNEKQKIRKIKTRKWLYNYLSKKKCVDCGEIDVIVLTFDHLREKEFNISNMVGCGYSIDRIKNEIKKCEIVCSNCHMRRTARRSGWYEKLGLY